ncbi:DsbA family protein [Kribbella sp. CA-293567]|uniref:DsbA family protein n=1 Tax=Kribbella sp. CA-293567 TaxID=3002436 RepID=UPI0022DD7A8F|nr:thioredoxin domain-containing protein [Kribbella sp. CA-293567]WBQ02407.1 thioredoxin domain-containing protein [Kribbella sp. CA-293567]
MSKSKGRGKGAANRPVKGPSKPVANPLVQPKKRRIGPGIVIVGIVVLALVAAVGVDYWRKNSSVEVSSDGRVEPAMITAPGKSGEGVTVGKEGAKTHIDVYLDFRCPHCAEFERETGPAIDALVEDGTATLTYWPMDFVNPEASPRLANAFAAAAANGKALTYADEMFEDFTKAWTTDQLLELGKKLGIGDAKFEAAVKDNSYKGWLDSISDASTKREVTGTPTVFVNGKRLDGEQLTVDGIKAAVSGIS